VADYSLSNREDFMETDQKITHQLEALDHTGDTKLIWDSDKPEEVDAAREMFNKLKKKGYAAYSVEGKHGEKGTVLKEFDPDAERIIMCPMVAGG
jgi:hypothetical protein